MGRTEDKLNNIFNDEDADDIFGPVKTKTTTKRSSTTQIEKNFADVIAFFENNGRLPIENSDDGSESGVWIKLDAIRGRDDFRAQVAHMDTLGLLDMVDKDEHSHVFDIEVPDINFDDIKEKAQPTHAVSSECDMVAAQENYEKSLQTIDAECEQKILETGQSAVKPMRETLSKLTHGLSVEVFNLQGAEETGINARNRLADTANALVKTAKEIQSLAERMGAAADHLEKEEAGLRIASKSNKDNVSKPVLKAPEQNQDFNKSADPLDEKMSLDDILADDDFDDLLGDEFAGSDGDSILGGQRAIKAHVRESSDQTNREPCLSFETYRKRFEQYKAAIENGKLNVSSNPHGPLTPGDLFLWDGLIALLSGESIDGDVKEHTGKRLHVVFSNGTEAWLREGSIKRSMYALTDRGNKIVCKRLVPVSDDLFTADGSDSADENTVTGYIYIARTMSKDPGLAKIRKGAVKIGVTKNPVSVRVANAEKDPTFLCAPIDVVGTFTLHNLLPKKVEGILHAFFGDVRLKIGAKDRFNNDVTANEWFLTNPKTVSEAIELLIKNDIENAFFEKESGKIKIKGEK